MWRLQHRIPCIIMAVHGPSTIVPIEATYLPPYCSRSLILPCPTSPKCNKPGPINIVTTVAVTTPETQSLPHLHANKPSSFS